MNDITPRKIKTGSDPRTLSDYAALRDELSKLTHPARPDVSWRYAEKLCLSLFEQNGVELQTAAWYRGVIVIVRRYDNLKCRETISKGRGDVFKV